MARAPYRPVELSEALRPVAAPVDTFIHAQEPPRDNNLADLARSLSGLGGSLAGLVGARDKKAEEDDAIRGEAAAWQANGKGAADAVAQGLIPAQASPAFMRSYKKVEGEVAGGVLEQKFATAYNSWDGKTSADPAAYDAFVGKFLKENVATQDPDVLRGLVPKVRQMATNYLQQHIGDTSKATMQGAIQASAAKDNQAIEAANSAGLASRQGTDYPTVFSQIEANRTESLKSGQNKEQYDKQVVDGITSAAVKLRDPKILDFLDRKVPGTDYSWSNTPYGRDERQKAMDSLETMGRRAISDDEKKRREEKVEAKDGVTRDTIGWITQHPNDPVPEELLARGEKVDADFRVNAIRWRDTIGKGTQVSDNGEMLQVTTDILNGGGLQVVQKAMARGAFKNPEDLTKAYKLAESMDKGGVKLDAILKSGSSKTILDTIKARTATDKDASKFFDDGSVSAEGLQAQTDYKLQVLAWQQAHPDANAIEQEKAISDIGAGILKRIVQPDGPMTAVQYDRQGMGNPNTHGAGAPATPEAAPQAPAPGPKPPAAPAGKPTASTTVPNPFQPDAGAGSDPMGNAIPGAPAAPAPPSAKPAQADPAAIQQWFNGLPPETRARMELKAAQDKKPLSLLTEEVYQKGVAAGVIKPPPAAPGKQSMRAPDGTPIETASVDQDVTGNIGKAFEQARDAAPAPDTVKLIGEAFERAIGGSAAPQGNYTVATLKNDPKAARILDFVAGPESRGNYNAYYGHGGSTKDLSTMTLDQIIPWSANRGTKSSATGRYQFMHDTLVGLKQEMRLSGSEKFTPELQDKMALQLLERRGYSSWLSGKISTEKFGSNLALEWASLPLLQDTVVKGKVRPGGQGAYNGDGLNKHLVSAQQVRSMLEGTGALPATALADAAQAAPQRPGIAAMIASLFKRRKPPGGDLRA